MPGFRGELFNRIAQIRERYARLQFVRQKSPFEPIPEISASKPLLLEGYFQHPDWFARSWRSVAQMILQDAPEGVIELRNSGRSMIKLRRSDYIDLGWELPLGFYDEAIQRAGMAGTSLVVTCEDEQGLEWITPLLNRHSISLAPALEFHENPDINDFWNVVVSTNVVCANSSFSWWACAVGDVLHSKHNVVYPRPWITNLWTEAPAPDLGLPSWHPVDSQLLESRVM